MSEKLEQKSTTILMMELLYQQEAMRWPEIVSPDQIYIEDLLRVLEQRANSSFDGSVAKCCEWYLGPSSPLAEKDKARIARMQDLRDEKREFTSVFDEILSEMSGKQDP